MLCGAAAGGRAEPEVPAPPMGWMTWNLFGVDIHEEGLRRVADAMVESGMAEAGYTYLYIDDGWQGGRDKRNNIIPDPEKFPSGMKALADHLHQRGLKLGIYSDGGQLSCAGYTASYGFEEQDAKTFASWGVDYLKYDYCNAPQNKEAANARFKAMGDALRKSGRDIVFAVCCQVHLEPWKWGRAVGAQLWRTGPDSRDKWKNIVYVINCNAGLHEYAGPGGWNDMCMLSVGMHGEGATPWIKGTGCTGIEYRTQMSIWCMMAAPLTASCDLLNMSETTKRILMNKELIAVNQDQLGKQAVREVNTGALNVFVKPLSNGDHAVAILNLGKTPKDFKVDFAGIGLPGRYKIRDLWKHEAAGSGASWQGNVRSHETKVFRLSKMP